MGPCVLLVPLALASLLAPQRPRPSSPPPPPAPAPPAPPAAPGGKEAPAPPRGRGASDDKGPRTLGFEEIEQQEGKAGDLPPLVMRMDFSVASVDLDDSGRSRVDLAGLCATGDGFAVFASDERDGGRTHFVQRLDAGLVPRGEPFALDPAAGGLGQHEVSPAVSPEGRLAAVWFDAGDRLQELRGVFLDVDPAAESGPAGLAGVWKSPLPAGRDAAVVSSGPALALAGEWCWVAWNTAQRIVLRELDPRTAKSLGDRVFGRAAAPATSAPRLAAHGSGELALAYETGSALALDVLITRDETTHTDLGLGRLCGLAADPFGPSGSPGPGTGWWVLVRRQGTLRLVHLDRGGAPDRPEVELDSGPARVAELAASPLGLCVMIQPPNGGLAALWCDDGGVIARTELAAGDANVLASRLALGPERAAFAWTERVGGAISLRVRAASARGEALSEPRAVEGCRGCAVQREAAVAVAGEVGVAVWSDQRFDAPCIGVRGFTAARTFAPRETFLPAQGPPDGASAGGASAGGASDGRASDGGTSGEGAPSAAARRPAVALLSSGRGLVAWFGAAAGRPTVLAQAIDVDAQGSVAPAGAPFVVEPEPVDLPMTFPPAVVALREDAGFALAWVRASPGTREEPRAGPDDGRAELRVLRVGASGRADGAPRTIGRGSRLAHPALAALDDGRVVAVWDEQPRVRARRLAARVLDASLEPGGRTLAFETMWRDSDHTPSVAPAEGGFALAWVSGEDPDSDVFARLYDADGRPLSRPLALSTRGGGQTAPSLARASDGSHVAVWQDDLSRSTRLVGRRFVGRTRVLGPTVRFAFGPEPGFVDAARPSLVALPGGALLLVGDHAVRGRGREVGLCRVAPGWDQVEGR